MIYLFPTFLAFIMVLLYYPSQGVPICGPQYSTSLGWFANCLRCLIQIFQQGRPGNTDPASNAVCADLTAGDQFVSCIDANVQNTGQLGDGENQGQILG